MRRRCTATRTATPGVQGRLHVRAIEKGSAPCDAKLQPGMATTEAEILAREAARPTAPPVVEFRRVSKRYDNGMGLDDASFTVGRGEFVFLVGSTGSGKSTVMRLLIKELEPTSGTIRVAGRDLAEITRKKVPFFRRNLGVVFQDFKLLPNRTVHDNVAYALQVTGSSRKEVRAKVPDILRLTGLSTKLHHFPDQLSGGEQQRVSVARAFVNHPPLLLADEPTGNLDPETSIGIMQLLYRINRTGTTVIVATHDSAMVDRMRRRVIELSPRAHHPRRGLGPLRAARHVDRRVRRAPARARARAQAGPRARRRVRRGVPRLMRIGFFLREAFRSMSRNAVPSFAAMASVLVTVLVLGVFIPVVQATTGAANDVRSRVLVNVYLKTDAKRGRRRPRPAPARRQGRPRRQGPVPLQGRRAQGAEGALPRGLRPAGLQPAARHLPRHARQARQRAQAARCAVAHRARRRAHDDRPVPSTRSRTPRTTRRRSSSPRAW